MLVLHIRKCCNPLFRVITYTYKTTKHKEQNDTHIFVTYILNTLRRFTVCYCGEKLYEKYRGLRWCENGLG